MELLAVAFVHVRRPTRRCWGFEDDRVGLTPKSKRGLAAGEVVEAHQAARCVVTDWRRINRLRLRLFRFRKCKNRLHLTVDGFF